MGNSEQPQEKRRGWLKNGNPPGDYSKAPRCGAKTRAGTTCRCPAVRGKKRCRVHGGAKGSGAPKGNKNAFKHGNYSAVAKLKRRETKRVTRALISLLLELEVS